jgi:hypothetical protein
MRRSVVPSSTSVVLEPAFRWARGDESIGFTRRLSVLIAITLNFTLPAIV